MDKIVIQGGLTVLISEADYEWAKDYVWFIQQRDGRPFVVRNTEDPDQQYSLVREIAIRALGCEFIKGRTEVYLDNGNPFDCRRRNVIIKHRLGAIPRNRGPRS